MSAPSPSPTSPSQTEAQRSIDQLVQESIRYRTSKEYLEYLRFAGSFRGYSPTNALLVDAQRPGSVFVAPANRWLSEYGRRVLPGQQPILVLQPFGPVMFVYDVNQTEPVAGGSELPLGVSPFTMPAMRGVEQVLGNTIRNAMADGVRVHQASSGSFAAGCIAPSRAHHTQTVQTKRRPPTYTEVRVHYEAQVNSSLSATAQYATLAHELGHLYCGHVGTHNQDWWRARHVSEEVGEFEAESSAFIACVRVDETATLPPYLDHYLTSNQEVPPGISLERVAAAAGRIIELSEDWLAPRRARDRRVPSSS